MTEEEVLKALDIIRASVYDDEVAHGLEDALHRKVLSAIAKGTLTTEEARKLAALAITTLELDFRRWCA